MNKILIQNVLNTPTYRTSYFLFKRLGLHTLDSLDLTQNNGCGGHASSSFISLVNDRVFGLRNSFVTSLAAYEKEKGRV